MNILVTGGCGFIGSHTVVELLFKGHHVTILDNFSNSSPSVVQRIFNITKCSCDLVQGDICDREFMYDFLENNSFDAVIHFAGLKSVSESIQEPAKYLNQNVGGSLILLDAMSRSNVNTLIFSSSATIYGGVAQMPVREESGYGDATNAYGESKILVEKAMSRIATHNPRFSGIALRYFNPIGAHQSGMLGEDPTDTPTNLMPVIGKVARGEQNQLCIFGTNYETRDGTAIRDFIHVVDLARGHLKALEFSIENRGFECFNLGTGRGTTVKELVAEFASASNVNIPIEFQARRDGDLPVVYADCTKANDILQWKAELSTLRACEDAWRWWT